MLVASASARSLHWTLTVAVSGTANGHVVGYGDGGSLDCTTGQTCQALLATDSGITLEAQPDPGVQFGGWGGDCSGDGSQCYVTMDSPKGVTASFGPAPPPPPKVFPLSVTRQGPGTGYVGGGAGIDCGPTCNVSPTAGSTIQLVAVPDASSVFTGWQGACSGTGPCNVTMSGPQSVVAAFALLPPKVTAFGAGGLAGHPVVLHFRVEAASGQSRTRVLVVRRHKVIARPPAQASSAVWRAPATVTGTLKFCVVAVDPVANLGGYACAPLRLF
jgi:hypothetical protein